VSGDLVPAIAAASVGGGMLATIVVRERRLESQMRRSRVRLSLTFPASLDPDAATLALGALAGISERMELVWEVAVTAGGVTHAVLVPQAVRSSVVSGLTAAIPALRVAEALEPKSGTSRVALRVFVPTPCVLTSEHPEQSDIPDYLKVLRNRLGIAPPDVRRLWNVLELTSRLRNDEIPKAMEDLEITTSGGGRPVDICLASNIIEVGIDIDRLSLMCVVGQPKTTSQYIQVTGRIGRRWNERPGLVAKRAPVGM
jgi:Lhr-like helicase